MTIDKMIDAAVKCTRCGAGYGKCDCWAKREWKVEGGALILPSGNTMKASCHHRNGSACGGCYARMFEAIEAIQRTPEAAKAILAEVTAAMRADAATKRKTKQPRAEAKP